MYPKAAGNGIVANSLIYDICKVGAEREGPLALEGLLCERACSAGALLQWGPSSAVALLPIILPNALATRSGVRACAWRRRKRSIAFGPGLLRVRGDDLLLHMAPTTPYNPAIPTPCGRQCRWRGC